MKIDAFAHILPRRYFERVDEMLASPSASARIKGYRDFFHEDASLYDLDARWRALEQFEDYRQVLVLAVPPIEELGDTATTASLARLANDEMAELVNTYPDRFVGFAASLPLDDVDASLAEIERAIGELGALGVQVHSNVGGAALDEDRFEPIFATMAELERMIWLHPTRSEVWPDYPTEERSRYDIWWSLGWPYETAVAMARLVYSGYLDRYPDLRIIAHHGGALIPHFSGRLAVPPWSDGLDEVRSLKRGLLDYFRMFYVDTAMFGAPHAVRSVLGFFGVEHVLFGTDTPLGGPRVIEDTIADLEASGLSDNDLQRVFEGNARTILSL